MKKIFRDLALIFLLSIMVSLFKSCKEDNVNNNVTNYVYRGSKIDIIIIDNCQYLVFSDGAKTHKGNCNNPAHQLTCPCEETIEDEIDTTVIRNSVETILVSK